MDPSVLVMLMSFFSRPCFRRGRKVVETLCTERTLVDKTGWRSCMKLFGSEVSEDMIPALLIRTSRPRPSRIWLAW